MLPDIRPAVLLASTDARLIGALQELLPGVGLALATAADGEHALAAAEALTGDACGLLLLDVRLPGVASGQLLASLHERGLRRRWAIALIAEQVSDEWIARLREGVIDDIVPRASEASAWITHLSTMQRGHALYCQLEYLRENSLLEVKHDPVTGALNRDTLLTILFRETDRVQRLDGPLSILALDLDHFTHWNQEVGREGCDQLLREVVRRTGRLMRTYDALGRLSRDEFLLILPGCSAVNAVMLAERLCVEVFGEPFWIKIKRAPQTSATSCESSSARAATASEIVEIRLSACFGVTLSRGRSPVVVVREAEQMLAQARQLGPGTIRCGNEAAGRETESVAQLFPEAETVLW